MSIADKLTDIATNQQKVYDAGRRDKQKRIAFLFWDRIYNGNNAAHALDGASHEFIEAMAARDEYPDGVHIDTADYMFASTMYEGSYYDSGLPLPVLFNDGHVTADGMYSNAQFTVIPPLDLTSCMSAELIFANSAVVIIDGLKDERRGFECLGNGAFNHCSDLEEIRFTDDQNTFITTNLDLHWSTKLTRETLLNIINMLSDKKHDTSGTIWEIKLGSANIAKLTDEELEELDRKGWSYS